jgi:hypothetical protein
MRPVNQKADASCNPIVIFGVGLCLAQLVIFNLATNFVGTMDKDSQTRSTTVHQKSLQEFLQVNPKRPTNKKRNSIVDSDADGTFGGYPVYWKEKAAPRTLSHCVGEDYQQGKAWMRKSCHFEFFCFDTSVKEFVVYQSVDEERIYPLVDVRPFVDISQSYLNPGLNRSNSMSLGGINLKWGMNKADGIRRLEWFPEIRKAPTDGNLSYYELPSNAVMVPFHSMNGANPGHLVWDDFLPVFTLLTMFQLEEDSELLMMRYILKDGRGLWASCDWKDEKREMCEKMHRKFLPLMVGEDSIRDLMTTENFIFEPKGEVKSNLVCARNGVAGFGALTDHGPTKLHGWEEDDYKITHNHGRGGMLYEFRNFMMSNIGVPVQYSHVPPFRIVFSEKSSENQMRNLDFRRQVDVLRRSFNPSYVTVESYVFKDIPLIQQVEIASQTTIYISGVGGGAVTATFLPRGASVFLYFLETGGVQGGRDSGKPARLDWDLFNNIGYLKVHWLPRGTMYQEADLRSLVLLVQHELDALMRERNYDKFFY